MTSEVISNNHDIHNCSKIVELPTRVVATYICGDLDNKLKNLSYARKTRDKLGHH